MSNKKTCIIVDSCSGIKNNEIKDVYCLPLTIIENDDGQEKIYADLTEINIVDVIKKISSKKDLKTSQTSMGEMLDIFEKLTPKYERIFVVPISSGLSGSYETWNIAKEEFENSEIHIVNSKDLGPGNKAVVDLLIEMIKQNKSPEEILKKVEERKKKRYGCLVVTDLEQLKKGGRINTFKALIAKTLKFNIIISFDGSLDFYDKDRSLEKAIDKSLEKINKETNYLSKGIKNAFFYTSFLDDNKNAEIKKIIDSKLNVTTEQSYIPSVIAVHTGPNAFAIYIETK
ncbi:MAG: DegV family protein [Malacoplasma sp.]|nr:DegV family protein [Malacoplasma sp.]